MLLLLCRYWKPAASRYKLKQAILELDPSDYPFEQFIDRLLKAQSYTVAVGQIVQGRCIQHEVKVVDEKGQKLILVECKYHNHQGPIQM